VHCVSMAQAQHYLGHRGESVHFHWPKEP